MRTAFYVSDYESGSFSPYDSSWRQFLRDHQTNEIIEVLNGNNQDEIKTLAEQFCDTNNAVMVAPAAITDNVTILYDPIKTVLTEDNALQHVYVRRSTEEIDKDIVSHLIHEEMDARVVASFYADDEDTAVIIAANLCLINRWWLSHYFDAYPPEQTE